jgi:wyosine [tRNA(Phe)-imidazoG37] synthetase (radical SAM superfamily)
MKYSHLFGPVQSRRLGRSLGVDMIPFKTCNCNCVYCECGGAKTVAHERKAYVPAEELIGELDHYLSAQPVLDYVTFAGSGEPTLNTALGTVLQFVKQSYPSYKTALLTNGTLLHLPDVRDEILPFDLILPSLDAISEEVFHRINRPFPGATTQQMIDGLVAFSQMYKGQLWIEVFIVPGINDTPEELALFKTALLRINPTRVQLNSLDRPGACEWVVTASPGVLASIAAFLKPLPVEIISRNAASIISSMSTTSRNLDATIRDQLLRRPATVEEIAVLCGMTINEIMFALNNMIDKGGIGESVVDGRKFYSIAKG